MAIDEEGNDILDIVPEYAHQRTALYVGSIPLVENIREKLKG